MIDLLAAAFDSGRAFVRWDKAVYVVFPPYGKANMKAAEESAVGKAVGTFGFVSCSERFPSWRKLIAFLHERHLEAHDWSKADIDTPAPVDGLLEGAPIEVIKQYLDSVESSFVPEGRLDTADDILLAVLNLPLAREDADLNGRTIALLNEVRGRRKEQESFLDGAGNGNARKLDPRFTLAVEEAPEEAIISVALEIQEQGFFCGATG